MDNSYPNDGQQNQNSQPPQTNYQQYLEPQAVGSSNKRRKIIIFASIGLLALVVIIIGVILLSSKNKNANQASSQVTTCSDSGCFEGHFKQCTPAEYTYVEPESSIKYTIKNPAEVGCNTEVTYLKSQYVPDEEGKSMTCEFDNSTDFQTAAKSVFNFPDDFSCNGDLTGFFQTPTDSSEAQ